MIDTQQGNFEESARKKLFALHSWVAILFGALSFALVVTGTILVFDKELSQWAKVHQNENLFAEKLEFQSGLNKKLQQEIRDIESTDKRKVTSVLIRPKSKEIWQASFTIQDGKDNPRIYRATDYHVATWEVVKRLEGDQEFLFDNPQEMSLIVFLEQLHFRLFLPDDLGLLATGIIGIALLLSAVTGLVIYRNVFRKIFVLKLSTRNLLLTARDRHMLAGSWGLVFIFIISLSGAFLSLGSSYGLPIMAFLASGGDREKLIETVVGNPPADNPDKAALGDVDKMITHVLSAPNVHYKSIFSVSINRVGREDSFVNILVTPQKDDFAARSFIFKSTTAALLYEKPILGRVASVGNQLYSLTNDLHFGDFAGYHSQFVWFTLGLAFSYVIFSGLVLFVQRRKMAAPYQKQAALLYGVFYAIPVSLLWVVLGYFFSIILDYSILTIMYCTFAISMLAFILLCYFLRRIETIKTLFYGMSFILVVTLIFIRQFMQTSFFSIDVESLIINMLLAGYGGYLLLRLWDIHSKSKKTEMLNQTEHMHV